MEGGRDVYLAFLLGDVLHGFNWTCLHHPKLEDTAGCDDNTGCLSLYRLVLVRIWKESVTGESQRRSK